MHFLSLASFPRAHFLDLYIDRHLPNLSTSRATKSPPSRHILPSPSTPHLLPEQAPTRRRLPHQLLSCSRAGHSTLSRVSWSCLRHVPARGSYCACVNFGKYAGSPEHAPSNSMNLGNLARLENGVGNAAKRGADIEGEDERAGVANVRLAGTRGGLHGGSGLSRGGDIATCVREGEITDSAAARRARVRF